MLKIKLDVAVIDLHLDLVVQVLELLLMLIVALRMTSTLFTQTWRT